MSTFLTIYSNVLPCELTAGIHFPFKVPVCISILRVSSPIPHTLPIDSSPSSTSPTIYPISASYDIIGTTTILFSPSVLPLGRLFGFLPVYGCAMPRSFRIDTANGDIYSCCMEGCFQHFGSWSSTSHSNTIAGSSLHGCRDLQRKIPTNPVAHW